MAESESGAIETGKRFYRVTLYINKRGSAKLVESLWVESATIEAAGLEFLTMRDLKPEKWQFIPMGHFMAWDRRRKYLQIEVENELGTTRR